MGEDKILEDNPHFWELIEAGKQHIAEPVETVVVSRPEKKNDTPTS
jgi:hypothetical protein